MIKDIIKKINLHKKRLKLALEEIQEWEVLDSEIFENFYIYRFIKLQDIMGEKLFKLTLDEVGEYKDNMSLLDILDKLEKLELIKNANDWMMYRKLRNQLTHEYPNNEDDVIEGIKIAIESYNEIEIILNNIEIYLKRRVNII